MYSRDRGDGWRACVGLPPLLRPVADRRDPALFYALDFRTGDWFVSVDGAASFAPVTSRGLPDVTGDRPTWREDAFPLKATPGTEGDLWLVSAAAPDGARWPTLFAVGTRDSVRGVFRSDDRGRSWMRINDDRHEYGRRFRAIAGDPRVTGRVYLATDGRGILYGDPV